MSTLKSLLIVLVSADRQPKTNLGSVFLREWLVFPAVLETEILRRIPRRLQHCGQGYLRLVTADSRKADDLKFREVRVSDGPKALPLVAHFARLPVPKR